VFVRVIDPVGSGLVTSLTRPGANVTGFVMFEYALAAGADVRPDWRPMTNKLWV
jgi:hypothetical protein